jgi:hypothetical protein
MDLPDSARTNDRPSTRRPGHAAPARRPRPRRPAALPSQRHSRDQPPPPPGVPVSAFFRGSPAIVGGVGLAFFVVQAALGWGLGVAGAGLAMLVAVMLLAVLVVTDAFGGRPQQPGDEAADYDPVVCGAVATTVAVAIACLYLPLPWGGLCAAVVLAGLVVAMRLR